MTAGQKQPISKVVWLYVVGFVAFSVVAMCSKKLVNDTYGSKYVFFRSFLTNSLYVSYAAMIVFYKLLFTNDITPAMRRIPLWKFAGIGFCDGLGDFLQSVGGVHTPGNWQVLLTQLVIPLTMGLSLVILKVKYSCLEVSGASLILAGILFALSPLFTHSEGTKAVWYSVVLYCSGQIPASASSVFKEVLFKSKFVDLFYLTTVVSTFQLCLIWGFMPLQSFHSFGGVATSEIGEVFRDGWRCFVGGHVPIYNQHNVLVSHCSVFTTRSTMIFSVTGFFSGLFQLSIVKHGSAALMVVSQALCLPLANMAFSIEAIMGPESVEPFSYYDLGGLVIVMLGFFMYRYTSLSQLKTLAGNDPTLTTVKDTLLETPFENGDDDEEDEGGTVVFSSGSQRGQQQNSSSSSSANGSQRSVVYPSYLSPTYAYDGVVAVEDSAGFDGI